MITKNGDKYKFSNLDVNPLNAELNPTCHLLALLGAHHILHVSRVRVNPLNPELNPFCKSQFAELFRAVIKFCPRFLEKPD